MELKVDLTEQKLIEQKKVRTFGVEIECFVRRNKWGIEEGVRIENELKAMGNDIGTDGSIRPIDGFEGIELRTPALSPKIFKIHIARTCELLAQVDGRTNKSCGLHLHVGNLPQDYKFVVSTFEFMKRFEKDIYSMLPPSRRENTYCKQIDSEFWEETIDPKIAKNHQMLKEMFYGKGRTGNSINHGNDKRYYGLNLHSLFYRGTIEFRYHSGTHEANKILQWQKMVDGIFNFIQKNYTTQDIFNKKVKEAKNLYDLLQKEGCIDYVTKDYAYKRIKKFNRGAPPIEIWNSLVEKESQIELDTQVGRMVKYSDGSVMVSNHRMNRVVPADIIQKIETKLGSEWYKKWAPAAIGTVTVSLISSSGAIKRITM